MNAPLSTTRRLAVACAGAVLGIGALAGCSSSSDTATESASATPSATATAAYCAGVDTVKASLDSLVNTSVIQEGTSTLKSRYETFTSDVSALADSAREAFAAETAAVDTSVAALKASIDALAESPSVAQAAALKPALQAVATSTQALIDAVQGACATS